VINAISLTQTPVLLSSGDISLYHFTLFSHLLAAREDAKT
jgi:hypothetical protein